MSNTFRLPRQNGGAFNQILRTVFLAISAIGGLVMLFLSTAFVIFLIVGIVVMALIVAAVFWARAKILGKPFGPKAQVEKMRRDMEQGMGANMGNQFDTAKPKQNSSAAGKASPDGPIIDAHHTPEGWSVDS